MGVADNLRSNGGNGAMVAGILTHTNPDIVYYAFVGSQGNLTKGGYNGGDGHVCDGSEWQSGGGGGGATDLRIYNNDPGNRIAVAAGGAGGIGLVGTTGVAPQGGNVTGLQYDLEKTMFKCQSAGDEYPNLLSLSNIKIINSTKQIKLLVAMLELDLHHRHLEVVEVAVILEE